MRSIYADSDTSALTGIAAYSFSACGVTHCPFMLGDLNLDASSSLDVDVRISGVTKTKTISNLNVRLLYPVLAKYSTSSNVATFNARSVVLMAEFDLSGPQFGSENGHKVYTSRNTAAVTGTVNPSLKTFVFDDLEEAQGSRGNTDGAETCRAAQPTPGA